MKGLRIVLFAVSLVLFLGAPYIPNSVLSLTVNSYVGVIVILVGVLLIARMDVILALAAFLAAGALFLENRKRVLTNLMPHKAKDVPTMPYNLTSVDAVDAGVDDLVEGEVHPEHEEPSSQDHPFAPTEDSTNDFQRTGESIDMKQPLETASANSSQQMAAQLTRAGVV